MSRAAIAETSAAAALAPVERGRVDYLLLGATVALLVVGTLMVYSASFVVAHNEFGDDLYFLTRHLRGVGLGAVLMLVAARLDYRALRRVTLLVLLITVGLLIAVLVPGVGSSSYGSSRWINLGPLLQIQPSEIAKLALVVYLADWLGRRGRQVKKFGNGLLPFAIIVVIVAGLVELQPDLGTTFVIVGAAACVFFVAGANLLHVGMIGSAGALVGVWLIMRMAGGYRQDRIAAFLDPWSDVQGHGWHTAQTLIALGSGGLTGMGLGGSHQKFYWVPNAHTDAIFAIIGEELGFVGAVGVLLLFVALAWRGFAIAWRAPDSFGRLLAAGITATLTLQALVNIAVVTNSVPYTGVTLPLVSYGSSSTAIKMLSIGLLLSISRRRGRYEDEEQEEEASQDTDKGQPAERSRVSGQRGRRGWALRPPLLGHTPGSSRLVGRVQADGVQARPTRRRAFLRGSGRSRGHSWLAGER